MKTSEILKTEKAITFIKETFSSKLATELSLIKVSSPIAVLDGFGINDDLNGTERPVDFPVKAMQEARAVVVHSLAKWKRQRLLTLGIEPEHGIYTDMKALRPDEDYSPLHSVYVDQWDWEKHIDIKDRSLAYLKHEVSKIYSAIKQTELALHQYDSTYTASLPLDIKFIHAEELLQLFPTLSPKEREHAIAKEHRAVFIIGIGARLSDGLLHDGRAADYDDWISMNEEGGQGLNGDIVLWNPVLECAFEISSMGIRVSPESLLAQLKYRNCEERAELKFHKMLLEKKLPQSIGGGIGQSRVCMFLLKKKHIGEVQVGIWPEEELEELAIQGLRML